MPPYSELVVQGSGPAYYDARKVPHGVVTRHVYHSNVTNGERELYVYTPPGYDRSSRYPTLYLLGGSGELPSNWIYDGRANFIMDNLLAEGKAVPMVIAIPNNQVVHRNNPKHTELTFKIFEADLRQHIIPLVERVGFNSLDLVANFGVLSAGDVDSEKTIATFLNDPDVNEKVDYLFGGQVHIAQLGQGARESRDLDSRSVSEVQPKGELHNPRSVRRRKRSEIAVHLIA